jgi:hypothetical protein
MVSIFLSNEYKQKGGIKVAAVSFFGNEKCVFVLIELKVLNFGTHTDSLYYASCDVKN